MNNAPSMTTLLEEMSNWDKDKRYMAASDISAEIEKSSQAMDLHMQKKICQAFLKQLDDQSIDVHAHSQATISKFL